MDFTMKTGFNNVIEEPKDEEFINFQTIFGMFAEDALKVASHYTLHSNRTTVTGIDTLNGMKTRFKYRDYFNGLPNVAERLQEIKKDLTEDNYDSLDNIKVVDETLEQQTSSECKCAMCAMCNETIKHWDIYIDTIKETLSPIDKYTLFAITKAENYIKQIES